MFFSESDEEIEIEIPEPEKKEIKPFKKWWPGRDNRQGNGPDYRCPINKKWKKEQKDLKK